MVFFGCCFFFFLTTGVYHLKTVLKEDTFWETIPFLEVHHAAWLGTGYWNTDELLTDKGKKPGDHLSTGAAR